jgi:hypothetical protein
LLRNAAPLNGEGERADDVPATQKNEKRIATAMSPLARSKQSFGGLPQMNDKIGRWTGMFFMEIVYICLFDEGNGRSKNPLL